MTTTQRNFRDIDLNFSAHPMTGDVTKKVGDDAIIQSMFTLLLAGKYDRLMQPNIYSNLRQSLFEPLDSITASSIKNEIESVIGKYEPRVSLTEVNVTPDYDNNGYSTSISFFIVNSTNPITVELFLERIR
jgi:phage baseplate assembly protein W